MPLIRALHGWDNRRMAVAETSYPTGQLEQTGWMALASGPIWLVLLLVALPVIAAIVLIGLVYEVVVRLDGGTRIPEFLRWAVASVIALAFVAVATAAVVNQL